jgi:cardiolipin synthase (CMP-forming)
MRLTFATQITLLRLLLIPFVAMSILYHRYGLALIIFGISGVSDLIDGLIARKFGQKTKLGALLDPMADKLLLSTSFILLTLPASQLSVPIPLWLTVMVFGRDIIIIVSAVAIALITGFTNFDPTIYGKGSTLLQIVTVLAVLLVNHLGADGFYVQWLFYLTFALTLFSGVHYLYIVHRRYNLENE